MHRHRATLGVPVALGIGASIDFAAGMARRAPRWIQRLGFEWLYGLARVPWRLWRRYPVDDSPFVFLALARVLKR